MLLLWLLLFIHKLSLSLLFGFVIIFVRDLVEVVVEALVLTLYILPQLAFVSLISVSVFIIFTWLFIVVVIDVAAELVAITKADDDGVVYATDEEATTAATDDVANDCVNDVVDVCNEFAILSILSKRIWCWFIGVELWLRAKCLKTLILLAKERIQRGHS